MSLILVLSISIRLAALAWSIALLRKVKDWRMGFFGLMLALMALRQILTLKSSFESWDFNVSGHANELPGLVVSVMAFLAIFFLEQILTERKELELEMMQITASEQQRIGRDLHDGIGQELTGMSYLAGALRDKLSERSADEASEAGEITAMIKSTIGHTREIVKGLCPVPNEEGGLADVLKDFLEITATVHGIQCECQCDPSVLVVDNEVANHLYFIAREAIHNAVKHSNSDRISLSFVEQNGNIDLEVRDYGIGMATLTNKNNGGRGLRIMNYRARLIGATLILSSHPGGGVLMACRYEQRH